MNFLIVIGAAHALYLSFLTLTKTEKGLSDYWLAAFLLFLAGVFFMVFLSFQWDMPVFLIFLWNANLLLAPFFFMYASALMDKSSKLSFFPFWQFVPYGISLIYLFHLLISLPEPAIDELFLNQNLYSGPPLFTFFSVLGLLVVPFYVIWTLVLLQKHRKKIANTFSNLEEKDLIWLKNLAIATLGLWLVIDGFVLLSINSEWISDEQSIQYGFAVAVFFIFYIGYFGVKQTAVFSGFSPNEIPVAATSTEKYKKSSLKEVDALAFSQKLLEYMEQNKPFLDSDLTIHQLSSDLNISYHHLSQILNEQRQCSFFDFVNLYRVEEFKKRIEIGDHKKFTLLAIALDCGFKAKSSFNRIFKNFTGITPGKYVKKEGA